MTGINRFNRLFPKPLCRPTFGGFTLLETLIALSVAATVLTAVYRLNAQSIAMTNRAGFQNKAALLAQEKMTALMLEKEYTRMMSDEGSFDDAFADWRWRAHMTPVDGPALNPDGHRMMQIEVSVFRAGRPDPYRLRAYHLFPEAR
jgi:type II secretion system protein I